MYIYIIIIYIISVIVYPLVQRKYTEKIADILVIFFMFIVCLFAMGFRDVSVGVDTIEYKKIFDDYLHCSWNRVLTDNADDDRIEIGFRILMKLCGSLSHNYYFYQFIFSFIYLFFSFRFIYKYTSNTLLTCAIFLGGGMFMQAFNIVRQMFAVLIVGYAIVNILHKHLFKSILIICIAYCFHSSSVIALSMLILYPFKNNIYISRLIPVIIAFLIVFVDMFLLELSTAIFDDKFTRYIVSDYSRPDGGIFQKVMWILNFILSLIGIYTYNNRDILFASMLLLIAVASFVVGLSINYVDRMGLFFLPAIMILYDRIGSSINNSSIKLIYQNVFIGFYIFYFGYWTYLNTAVSYTCIIE